MCAFPVAWYKPIKAVPSAAGDASAPEEVTGGSQPRSVISTPYIIQCTFGVNRAGEG